MSGKWDDPEYVREYFRLYREKNRERVYRIVWIWQRGLPA